jgi:hypothetical protein
MLNKKVIEALNLLQKNVSIAITNSESLNTDSFVSNVAKFIFITNNLTQVSANLLNYFSLITKIKVKKHKAIVVQNFLCLEHLNFNVEDLYTQTQVLNELIVSSFSSTSISSYRIRVGISENVEKILKLLAIVIAFIIIMFFLYDYFTYEAATGESVGTVEHVSYVQRTTVTGPTSSQAGVYYGRLGVPITSGQYFTMFDEYFSASGELMEEIELRI